MRYIKPFNEGKGNRYVEKFKGMCTEDILQFGYKKGWFKEDLVTIREDGFIDVDGDVDIRHENLKRLPLNFGIVNGNFEVCDNVLTTLVGCPEYVSKVFDCSRNNLKNLDGGPKRVDRIYKCNDNIITSMVGLPTGCLQYSFTHNRLTNTIGIPYMVRSWMEFWNNNYPKVDYLQSGISLFKVILKYQDEYGIWKSDGTLNRGRYDILVKDHKDGLIST